VTTGLVGAVAWLALFALFLVLGIRSLLLRASEDSFMRYVSILSFVAALYLFVVAIFGLPGSPVFAIAFVAAGVFASSLRYASGAKQWGVIFAKSPRIGFVVVFSLTLVLLVAVAAAYALTERYIAIANLADAAVAANAGNLDGADAALTRSLSFASQPGAYQLQALIASARISQVISSSTMPAASAQQSYQAALTSGINAALTSTRLSPNDYQNWIALGNLYASAVPLKVAGAYDSAKTAYQKAEALSPTNPQIPYALAQLDIANGDLASAETDLKSAITLKQDFTAAIFLLSQVEVQAGNVKDALAAAEAAAYFTPNDPNILFQVGLLRAAQNDTPGAIQALAAAVAANPQFANARYFLAAAYAKQKDFQDALAQVQAIAALSDQNAAAVASAISSLQAGKDPFPANLLSSQPPVQDTSSGSSSQAAAGDVTGAPPAKAPAASAPAKP